MRFCLECKDKYGPSCMSRANFYKWVQAFKDGRESITDDLRSGRPVDVSTPEAVQAVEDLIKSDRRVTLDEIATKLDISHGTVYAIVREKLHFSKVSCRWVPKMLTDDHKMQRLMASRASLRRYRKEGDAFLSRIVTTDETWVFHYEPESKRRSMEWKHVSSPVKKKFKSQKSLKSQKSEGCCEQLAKDPVHGILCQRNRQSNIKMEQVCCKGGRLC